MEPTEVLGLTTYNNSALLLVESAYVIDVYQYCIENIEQVGNWRFLFDPKAFEDDGTQSKEAQLYFPCKFLNFYTLFKKNNIYKLSIRKLVIHNIFPEY